MKESSIYKVRNYEISSIAIFILIGKSTKGKLAREEKKKTKTNSAK